MDSCCFLCNLSFADIIQIAIAIILLYTLLAIKNGNKENTDLIRLQAAKDTIMKQIDFHNNLLKEISVNLASVGRGYGYPNAPENAYGQEAFEIFYDRLKQIYITMPGYFENNNTGEEKRINDSFAQLYEEYGKLFGKYFKNLYLIVVYINDRNIKDFDKNYFIELVKSQLSPYEILLLAYDCIWIQDQDSGRNFIDFAKKYNLLSALETDKLIKSVSSVKHEEIFKNYGIGI